MMFWRFALIAALFAVAVFADDEEAHHDGDVVLQHKWKTTTRRTTTTTAARPTTPKPTTTKPTTKRTTTTTEEPTTRRTTTPLPDPGTPDASAFCFQCRSRRNHKDLYADTVDCHRYYQCFYFNETFATGILRRCPAGTFWHDQVLSCMPEGSTPCVDRCLDDATHAKGCYAGSGCRQFFVCANTASYGMCCPEGSSFNEASCSCEESATCRDACVQQGPLVGTSVAPASIYNATVCRDSFGTYISTVAGEANAYYLIDDEGQATEKLYCPTGVTFDLGTCRCDIFNDDAVAPNPVVRRRATLYLTFDTDTKDSSINKFSTFLYDGADRDASAAAIGGGSLAVNGGYLSIPGLKTYDSGKAGSWCAFFRGANGGILSNNKDSSASEFTVIFASTSATSFTARANFWHPVNGRTLNSASNANAWNHFCLTYSADSSSLQLYVNGIVVQRENLQGSFVVAHCPYVVGTDQSYGTFSGNIDEVLITPFEMTVEEVNAHRNGDRAYLASRGFW